MVLLKNIYNSLNCIKIYIVEEKEKWGDLSKKEKSKIKTGIISALLYGVLGSFYEELVEFDKHMLREEEFKTKLLYKFRYVFFILIFGFLNLGLEIYLTENTWILIGINYIIMELLFFIFFKSSFIKRGWGYNRK